MKTSLHHLKAARGAGAWLVLGLLAALGAVPSAATTHVVFRYDDLAADKAGTREFDRAHRELWEAEQAQDRLFAKFGMSYVVAIVPNMAGLIHTNVVPLQEDREKVEFIKQSVAAGRMQVALHGFTHWNYSAANARRGEFRRADARQQSEDVAAGRKILMDALGMKELTTFVPPYNGWNDHTAAALVRHGFEILSADRQWNAPADLPLTYIPFTAQLDELEGMLDHGGLPADSLVVVLYHPAQIFRMPGSETRYYGLDRMAALLGRLSTMPEVKVVSLDQLRATGSDLSVSRYNAAVNTGRLQVLWAQLLPAARLPGFDGWFIYQTERDYRRICLIWGSITLAAVGGILLAGWLLFRLAQKFLPGIGLRFLSLAALLGLGVSVWLIVEIIRRGFHPTSIRFFPFWLMLGWLLAALRRSAGRNPAPAPPAPNA